MRENVVIAELLAQMESILAKLDQHGQNVAAIKVAESIESLSNQLTDRISK